MTVENGSLSLWLTLYLNLCGRLCEGEGGVEVDGVGCGGLGVAVAGVVELPVLRVAVPAVAQRLCRAAPALPAAHLLPHRMKLSLGFGFAKFVQVL